MLNPTEHLDCHIALVKHFLFWAFCEEETYQRLRTVTIGCMVTMLDVSLLRQIAERQAGLLLQVICDSTQARDSWRQGDRFVIFL
jgi:hypothetical protein